MRERTLVWLSVVAMLAVAACKGGGPTVPSNTTTCSAPVVVSCPGPGFNGAAALGQISIAKGGSATCNVGVNEPMAVTFTIASVGTGSSVATVWGVRRGPNGKSGGPKVSAQPSTGAATTGATVQTTLQWTELPDDNANGTLEVVLGTAVVAENAGLVNNVLAACSAPLFVHN